MHFDSISIIFFVCPSLFSSISVIIYFEDKKICNFIPANMGYICGNVFLFIIILMYKHKIPKNLFKKLSIITIFLSLLSELILFLFYEIQFYMNDRKIENFLIFSRTTLLIFKTLAYNRILNFHLKRFLNLIGVFSILQIALFIFTGIEIHFNHILILLFQTISMIFIGVAIFHKKFLIHGCCAHKLFSEILQNLKLNLLVIEKNIKGNKIILELGQFSKDLFPKNLKDNNLIENSLNFSFSKLQLENKNTKLTQSISKTRKFSLNAKETQKNDNTSLNLNELIEQLSKNSSEKKNLKYPISCKIESKTYELIVNNFKTPNYPHEIYTIILKNENKTKRINQLEKIVDSNKRFFSSFSHELKTPINGSLPLMEMVKNSILYDKRNSELLEIAIGSIKLLHNSIDNILNFYLFESDQFIINASHFVLKDLIDEIKSIILPMAMVKNIQLIIKMEAKFDILKVHTDYEKLRQLFLNLLTNAIQFTHKGSIELMVESKSDNPLKIKFTISDTGIGIDELRLINLNKLLTEEESVFENQINSSGSCLGLLICQRIIFLLGGEPGINIKSRVGIGSEFSFFIDGGMTLQNDKNITPFNYLTLAKSYIDLARNARKNTCLIAEEKKKNRSLNRISQTIIRTNITERSKKSYNLSTRLSHKSMCFNEKLHNLYNFDKSLRFDRFHDDEIFERSESDVIMNLFKRRNSDLSVKSIISRKEASFDFIKKKCDCDDVLVVDDDAFNLLSMEIILKSFNFKCLKVMSGIEAIEKLKKQHNSCECKCRGIKLIWMDYQMPIMDGLQTSIEIINLIRKNEINNIPIIGCTAFISKDKIMDCLEIGMKDVIFKPITKNMIKRIIEEWMPLTN